MFKVLVLLAIVAIAAAQVRNYAREADAVILNQNYELNPDGSYQYK